MTVRTKRTYSQCQLQLHQQEAPCLPVAVPINPSLSTSPTSPSRSTHPPSNTLLITNLKDVEIFRPDNLQTIKDLINTSAPIHSWAPLKSFSRIIVSFYDDASAIRIRQILDGEEIMGEQTDTSASPTPANSSSSRRHPPPPRLGNENGRRAPNKQVHAEDLAEALAKLHHRSTTDLPASPLSDNGETAKSGRGRSSSTTTIYDPQAHGFSPNLPAIAVEDTTGEDWGVDSLDAEERPILAHTARPPVELMEC
ncbi:hypothetical protein DID88_005732 [Monilinia fructigena]|uniref:Calcipressin n=1 Tax=Monilinia fructigena TaxID=38457 RepID=A0A395J0P8_9HELO|nr:hypothetical protein DID88_005732 [Monilinia fructigena]